MGKGEKMVISKAIADNIKKATALGNKTRLRIVLAIYNTEVLKIGNSLTLSQLEKMLQIGKQDLSYHLLVLRETEIITKKEFDNDGIKKTYYQTTDGCIRILDLLGITKERIQALTKELSIEI